VWPPRREVAAAAQRNAKRNRSDVGRQISSR